MKRINITIAKNNNTLFNLHLPFDSIDLAEEEPFPDFLLAPLEGFGGCVL